MSSHTVTVYSSVGSGSMPVKIWSYLDAEYKSIIGGEIREGLTSCPKYIPSKYFYDATGSKLFEDICWLPEYYLTRTELTLLREIAPHLMRSFAHKDLVELGSGASLKIRILLDAAGAANRATMRYLPVDISESAVVEASEDLIRRYPELQVIGILADFTCQLDVLRTERPTMFCFLGSTIGNMSENESISFLKAVSANMKPDDSLLIGFDMVKERADMEAAYNDSRGVTAEFNRNILNVINNELNADFDSSHFDHRAFYNETKSRVEMHLEANRDTVVNCESIGIEVEFRKGETVHTENSRKFTVEGIEDMVRRAALSVREWYSDDNRWFSLVLIGPENRVVTPAQ